MLRSKLTVRPSEVKDTGSDPTVTLLRATLGGRTYSKMAKIMLTITKIAIVTQQQQNRNDVLIPPPLDHCLPLSSFLQTRRMPVLLGGGPSPAKEVAGLRNPERPG